MQTLLKDITTEESLAYEETNEGYKITTKANYPNNKDLTKQKIYIDKDMNIKKVEVMTEEEMIKMTMNIETIEIDKNIEDKEFELNNNINVSKEIEDTTSKINEITYPMYIPTNTYLSSQDTVSIESGERVIMTFNGDFPFMLVQETVRTTDEMSTIPVNGEPYQLLDTIGVIDDTSITWINNGIEYYLVSNTLEKSDLINVANSLSVAAMEK